MGYPRTKTIKSLPLHKRPREKLLAHGVINLTNKELLAIILGSGYQKNGVLKLAKLILKNFPLHQLPMACIKQLCQIKGIGSIQATKILASLELGQRSLSLNKQWKIDQPQKIASLMTDLKNKKQEYCYAFYINGRQELVEKRLLALGGFNTNNIDTRSIFAPAISLACPFFVLVHNHPSGDFQPSQADILTTTKIKKAAEILDIQLLDHIIISKIGFYSFKEAGLV